MQGAGDQLSGVLGMFCFVLFTPQVVDFTLKLFGIQENTLVRIFSNKASNTCTFAFSICTS